MVEDDTEDVLLKLLNGDYDIIPLPPKNQQDQLVRPWTFEHVGETKQDPSAESVLASPGATSPTKIAVTQKLGHFSHCKDHQCLGCDLMLLEDPLMPGGLDSSSKGHGPACFDVTCLGCGKHYMQMACPPPPLPLRRKEPVKASVFGSTRPVQLARPPTIMPPAGIWHAVIPSEAMPSKAIPTEQRAKTQPSQREASQSLTKRPKVEAMEPAGVNMFLASSKLAGLVAEHCCHHIQGLLRNRQASFKIGLTVDPCRRWANERYGYKMSHLFDRMHVLAELATCEGAAYLEAMLIDRFSSQPGCQNVAKGGEGSHPPATGPCYVYVVFKSP